ncbi:hypothetical protein VTL71DRAFT_10146 [Oculimacula yallundae]|uniref:Rhodopsin domain-containing protein n=1 Tax=Oculimacula yallundae TaxID=86028 RepID=A0ABR4BQM1_9HELO
MGWVYNLVNEDAATNASAIFGVGVFLTILSLSIVSLRMYVRWRIVRTITIDDWFIVATWLFSFIFITLTFARKYFPIIYITRPYTYDLEETRWGLGLQDTADIPLENIPKAGFLEFVGAPFYILSIFGFKISAIFTFLRTAVDLNYRRTIVALAIACSTFHFCFFVAQLNRCTPVAKQWDPSILDGKCLPLVPFNTAMGSFVIIFNILTMLTPIPILLHSCFSLRKNIMIGFSFVLGTLVTLASLMRILSISSQARTNNHSRALIWSMVETQLGIVAVSIVPLAPLFQSFLEKGSVRSLSIASFDTRRSYDKLKAYVRKMRKGKLDKTWNRLVLFWGYGDGGMKGDGDVEAGESRMATSRVGSRMSSRMGRGGGHGSTDELTGPMVIMMTTEVIVTRDGDEHYDAKG